MTESDRAELEALFLKADQTSDVETHLDFKEKLLEFDDPEAIEYHFNLIKRAKNQHLLDTLARFFKWRGESGKTYLLDRLTEEKDPFFIATGLQILGAMQCKESVKLARSYIEHPSERVRERACMVLGWTGTVRDIKTLGRLQLEETDINTRKWAATQQMHIWHRLPKTKDRVIQNLKTAIEQETEPEVLEMIVYTAQAVLKRRFGLKSQRNSDRMTGDLNEAKRKATVALTNYLKRSRR
jgi:hypothetical protein